MVILWPICLGLTILRGRIMRGLSYQYGAWGIDCVILAVDCVIFQIIASLFYLLRHLLN